MGCLGNSKTEDQRIDEKAQREANKKIEKQLQKERLAYKATHRLLLLGKASGQGRAGQGRGGRRGREPPEPRAGPGAPRPADAGGGGRCCAPAARPACHRAPSPFSSRGRRVGEKHHRETDEDPARQWV